MGAETRLLTPEEAADRIRVSTKTLRGFRQRGLIRYVSISERKILYRPEDCDAFVAAAVVQPALPERELPACSKMPQRPCVYFVRSGPAGPIKIGHAKNLRARLHALGTAHHQALILLATIAGGPVQEKRLHNRFAEHRIRGEWFHPAEPLLAHIETLQATERRG